MLLLVPVAFVVALAAGAAFPSCHRLTMGIGVPASAGSAGLIAAGPADFGGTASRIAWAVAIALACAAAWAAGVVTGRNAGLWLRASAPPATQYRRWPKWRRRQRRV